MTRWEIGGADENKWSPSTGSQWQNRKLRCPKARSKHSHTNKNESMAEIKLLGNNKTPWQIEWHFVFCLCFQSIIVIILFILCLQIFHLLPSHFIVPFFLLSICLRLVIDSIRFKQVSSFYLAKNWRRKNIYDNKPGGPNIPMLALLSFIWWFPAPCSVIHTLTEYKFVRSKCHTTTTKNRKKVKRFGERKKQSHEITARCSLMWNLSLFLR